MELSWIYGSLGIICILLIIKGFAELRQKLDDNARGMSCLEERMDRAGKRRRQQSREYEENIDRLKLANFYALQGKTEDAIDILSGRLSRDAIRSELLGLRKAVSKGGKIDPIWVIEETRIKPED